jgi:acyl carrier protein
MEKEGILSDEIALKVLALLQDACEKTGFTATIEPEQRLAALGIDSVKMIEITFELEKAFGLELQEALLSQLVTVRDLVDAARHSAADVAGNSQPSN